MHGYEQPKHIEKADFEVQEQIDDTYRSEILLKDSFVTIPIQTLRAYPLTFVLLEVLKAERLRKHIDHNRAAEEHFFLIQQIAQENVMKNVIERLCLTFIVRYADYFEMRNVSKIWRS
ncbi:hypothetical protein V1477_019373 [Vespula maculifrons]|uniref:Uncharacterized protein n=1 Tax=Vespula maculifrons TaxID=7453 RepID=A0ABD2ASC3_VESMC